MKKKFKILMATVLSIAVAFGALSASAWGKGDHGGDGDGEYRNWNILMARASMGLSQAAANLAKETEGVVLDAKIDCEEALLSSKESCRYRILTVRDGKVTESLIDLFTGKTLSQKQAGLVTRMSRLEVSPNSPLLNDLPLSMDKAIAAAEKHLNGKALNAELREEGGLLVYNVLTISENVMKRSVVDPVNGKVYLIPEVVDHGGEKDGDRER